MTNADIDELKGLISQLKQFSPKKAEVLEHKLRALDRTPPPPPEKDIETIPIEEFAYDLIHNKGKVINMERLKQEWEFIHQKENELKDSVWFKTVTKRKGHKTYIQSMEKTADKIAKLITFHDEYIKKAQQWAKYLRTFENPMQPLKDRTYFDLSPKELKEYFDDPNKNLNIDKRYKRIKTMLKKDLHSHQYINRNKFYKGVVLRLLNDYVRPIYKNMKEIKEFLSKVEKIAGGRMGVSEER